ncbi:hypothetical protein [Tepidibacter hydrothermalis]|uniref:Uncharacterized protein n=1 Tax=Tepidibacter hydrothermalis TaxID=3036126 RepID=A0ABY8EBQ5_9FIRM|nr:hypothetical protein [Tepidibacter hydrothermalis]WFD10231.1 hypothetical protein P4S50_18025 [Tepidibacter hydrothermalis]
MKKLGASLIICGMLASSNVVAFADTTNTKDVQSNILQAVKTNTKTQIQTNTQPIQVQIETPKTPQEPQVETPKTSNKPLVENKEKKEQKSIEIMKPVADYTVTTNNKVVVSGTGEEGSVVHLDVYLKNDKDGVFKKTDNSKTLEIGAMGFFLTEINLNAGENKIVIKNNNKQKTKIVKYTKIENKKEIQNNMDKITDKRIQDIFQDIITPK